MTINEAILAMIAEVEAEIQELCESYVNCILTVVEEVLV